MNILPKNIKKCPTHKMSPKNFTIFCQSDEFSPNLVTQLNSYTYANILTFKVAMLFPARTYKSN